MLVWTRLQSLSTLLGEMVEIFLTPTLNTYAWSKGRLCMTCMWVSKNGAELPSAPSIWRHFSKRSDKIFGLLRLIASYGKFIWQVYIRFLLLMYGGGRWFCGQTIRLIVKDDLTCFRKWSTTAFGPAPRLCWCGDGSTLCWGLCQPNHQPESTSQRARIWWALLCIVLSLSHPNGGFDLCCGHMVHMDCSEFWHSPEQEDFTHQDKSENLAWDHPLHEEWSKYKNRVA